MGGHPRLHPYHERADGRLTGVGKFLNGSALPNVEQITGRKVRAFVSGVDTRQDVSSEVFYFEPVAPAEQRRVTACGIALSRRLGGRWRNERACGLRQW